MLQSLREETEGKLQMLLSLRKNGLTSLNKEVRVFKARAAKELRALIEENLEKPLWRSFLEPEVLQSGFGVNFLISWWSFKGQHD